MGFLDFFKTKENKMEKRRSILNLDLNNIVAYDSKQYKIIGKIIYSKKDYKLYKYHLKNERDNFWLYAELKEELELYLFKKLPPRHQLYNKFLNHNSQTVTYDKQIFKLVEKGQAKVETKGQVGPKIEQYVQYYDYTGGNKRITVEKLGTELEVSVGINIKKDLIKIY